MKKTFYTFLAVLALVFTMGCTRIPTGEVGLRINMSNEVQKQELQPGSWNQTMLGNVLTLPVREIAVAVKDRHPLTADNSAMGDFDVVVVYSINPEAVSDIYSTKSKVFHHTDERTGEIQLMHSYLETLIVNASNVAVRDFRSLEVADKRQVIEAKIKEHLMQELAAEKLDHSLIISAVQITNATPNQAILDSSTAYVKSQNELKIKENEVQIARKEAERMAALAINSTQSISYMDAQARLLVAQGVKDCKVDKIVVPFDFHGIINTGK